LSAVFELRQVAENESGHEERGGQDKHKLDGGDGACAHSPLYYKVYDDVKYFTLQNQRTAKALRVEKKPVGSSKCHHGSKSSGWSGTILPVYGELLFSQSRVRRNDAKPECSSMLQGRLVCHSF